MYYVCKCIHICSMVIVFLQFRLGGLTRTRCWAIWPCTGLDPGTKVILVMFHHCFHLPSGNYTCSLPGELSSLGEHTVRVHILDYELPVAVHSGYEDQLYLTWPRWSSINIFNNCRAGERQQQGFWVIGILLTIADWWRETHRPGGTSTNPTRLWSASMSTILIPAPVLDLWGVLEFKVFSTNNFKGSVKQGNLSLGWRLSIGKPLLTNPN